MIDPAYLAAGALTGMLVGLTGVGGGALMTPLLIVFFGVSPTVAISTDLWFAALTKSAGALVHHNSGRVDWQVLRRLWFGSIPTALLVVVLVSNSGPMLRVDWLTHLVGAIVLVTALGLLISPKLYKLARAHRIDAPEKFKSAQSLLTICAGVLLGVFVALTSIGAGTLGSVLLLYLYPLRMTPHRLVATDVVHAVPLALVAGSGYLYAGLVDWMMLLSLLVGSIPAIVLGSFLAGKIYGRGLQIILALVLSAVGVKTLLSS